MTQKEFDLLDILVTRGFNFEFNRCCDDWDEELLRQINFTEVEIDKISKDFSDWNGDPEEYSPNRFYSVGMISIGMFLFSKMKKEIKVIPTPNTSLFCEICGAEGTTFCDEHFGEGWN